MSKPTKLELEQESNRLARTWSKANKKRRRAIDERLVGKCVARKAAKS